MQFEVQFKSRSSRVIVGVVLLLAFAVVVRHCQNAWFADRISQIPLFGTELAIECQPEDPQYEYELGNYWMIAGQQPQMALPHFQRATALDGYNGRYWAQEALAYQQAGDALHASRSIDRSLAVDPATPEILWQAANVYSYLGESEHAVDAIRRFVAGAPDQTPIAAQLGWRVTRNPKLLLDTTLPKGWISDVSLLTALVRLEDPDASARLKSLDVDPNNLFVHNLATLAVPQPSSQESNLTPNLDLVGEREKARETMMKLIDAKTGRDWTKTEKQMAAEHATRLQHDYEQKQTEKAQKVEEDAEVYRAAEEVWTRLMSEREPFDIRLGLPYIQMLIDADLGESANGAWSLLVAHEPRLKNDSSDHNLLKNGSFEYELINGGLDWQYTVSDAVSLAIDHHNAREGGSSLLMRFKDKSLADVGVVQFVPVKPGTAYEFSGYLKTDAVQAATGLRFRVQDTDSDEPYYLSQDLKGSTNWTKFTGKFTTRANAHVVEVRIVRDPGNTLINGQAWADSLRLVEATDH